MAAPVFDASSSGTGSSVSSKTVAHTTGSGANRILLVGVESQTADVSAGTVTGITYNSVAMTKIAAVQVASDARYQRSELWYLASPSSGANNIIVTFTGTVESLIVGGLSYSGASQGVPNTSNTATGTSTTPSCSVTTTKDECIVIDIVSDGNGSNITRSPDTGTERLDVNQSTETGLGMSEIEKATAGAQTRAWTLTGAPTWAQVVAAIEPPSTAGFLALM